MAPANRALTCFIREVANTYQATMISIRESIDLIESLRFAILRESSERESACVCDLNDTADDGLFTAHIHSLHTSQGC